jgi:Tol biopolymer transport system component
LALTPGTRLGVYEITAQIGEGGMGQVYRATDTTLGRQVAIKILPDAFAADPERLARFDREAKALASLNHPHIAAIYGFEKAAGAQALIMELVEGEDLSRRIARGAIPLDEALPIARQIAEALEAAHEQGIIHRDLKPANIKVRADGTVKVLDFGLAKAMESGSGNQRPGGGAFEDSPTITTPAMTMRGVILGTAAYMSPEQAKGKSVDRRADVWALGAVLYEMLAGQRAFKGEDTTDAMAAVVGKEPDWSALPADTPASIRKLLRRCLEKDRKRRLADAADARLEIEDALGAPAVIDAPESRRQNRTSTLSWAITAAALIAAGVMLMLWAPWRPLPVPPEARIDIVTPVTDDPMSFALSPDGRQIVFVASGGGRARLWLRSLSTTTARALAGTEGAEFPFWSPDGRSLGFFADGALRRLDLGGGTPQILAPALGFGGAWNADGMILFSQSQTSPVMAVPATGGAAAAVTTLGPRHATHRWPHLLPDGRRFLFFVLGPDDTEGIYLSAAEGGAPTRLTPSDGAGAYLPSGWLLWVRAGTLVAQRLDLTQAALVGEPVTVADGVAADGIRRSAISVATTGLVAYRTRESRERQLMWVDRSGTNRGSLGITGNNLSDPRVSPDGRLVVVSHGPQGNPDLWLLGADRLSRVTFDAAADNFPVWSPDSTRLVFRSNRTGRFDLYQKLASGGGLEESLVASDHFKSPTSWSSDGRFVLFHSSDPQTVTDLWVVPMVGERTPAVFLKTPFMERWAVFSPDGQWVAYHSSESGRLEIYVRPFVAPGTADTAAGVQWQVSTAGGVYPAWRPDGKELYYLNPAGAMMAASITVTRSTLTPGAPVVLFPTRIVGGGADAQQGRQYDVARDGRFLINTVLDNAVAPITLLQNWHPDLKE